MKKFIICFTVMLGILFSSIASSQSFHMLCTPRQGGTWLGSDPAATTVLPYNFKVVSTIVSPSGLKYYNTIAIDMLLDRGPYTLSDYNQYGYIFHYDLGRFISLNDGVARGISFYDLGMVNTETLFSRSSTNPYVLMPPDVYPAGVSVTSGLLNTATPLAPVTVNGATQFNWNYKIVFSGMLQRSTVPWTISPSYNSYTKTGVFSLKAVRGTRSFYMPFSCTKRSW